MFQLSQQQWGEYTELIQDGITGYLVEPGDAEALAQRITFALARMGADAAASLHVAASL